MSIVVEGVFNADSTASNIAIAGTHRVLLACVTVDSWTSGDPHPTVTVGPTHIPMHEEGEVNVGVGAGVELFTFRLMDPPTGTVSLNFSVPSGGSGDQCAIALSGVLDPLETFLTKEDVNNGSPVEATDAETGDVYITFYVALEPATITPDSGTSPQTELSNVFNIVQLLATRTDIDHDDSVYPLAWTVSPVGPTGGATLGFAAATEFTPSPCATLYIEADTVTAVADGDRVEGFVIPQLGTAEVHTNWGIEEGKHSGLHWHASGGANGLPYFEKDGDVPEFDSFFGQYEVISGAVTPTPTGRELLSNIIDVSDLAVPKWVMFCVVKPTMIPVMPLDDDLEDDLHGWLNSGTFVGQISLANWRFAFVNVQGQDYFYFATYDNTGEDGTERTVRIPITNNEWHYLEAYQSANIIHLRVDDATTRIPAFGYGAISTNSQLRIGLDPVEFDMALLQFCDIPLGCGARELRRWEIQQKYGFALSPIDDCSDDVPTTPEEVAAAQPQARHVQVIG
jgi:hypothetical protein